MSERDILAKEQEIKKFLTEEFGDGNYDEVSTDDFYVNEHEVAEEPVAEPTVEAEVESEEEPLMTLIIEDGEINPAYEHTFNSSVGNLYAFTSSMKRLGCSDYTIAIHWLYFNLKNKESND